MTIKVNIDGAEAIVDCGPYNPEGKPVNPAFFIESMVVPVAAIALNKRMEAGGSILSLVKQEPFSEASTQHPMDKGVLGKILRECRRIPKGATIRITKTENEQAVFEMSALFSSGWSLPNIPAIDGHPIEVIA